MGRFPWRSLVESPSRDVSGLRILFAAVAAFVTILSIALVTRHFLPNWSGPLLVASMGASSVLLFAVPASPMSQPWPLLAGHLSASIIGVSCARYLPDQALAAASAVAGAILVMHVLRGLHPPGGATALVAVVGGEEVRELGYQYIVTPVALDVSIVLLLALVLHHLLRRKDDSGMAMADIRSRNRHDGPMLDPPFQAQDLAVALEQMDTYIDVTHDDLRRIYVLATLQSYVRILGDHRVDEIMDRDPCIVEFATPLREAWHLLRERGRQAAVVVSTPGQVIGILTIDDFLRRAEALDDARPGEGLRLLLSPVTTLESERPEVAGQIMSRPVISARQGQRLAELVPVFAHHRIHHLPVLDDRDRLARMVTWEDVLAIVEQK